MAVNSVLMAQAFQAGAGFSADELSLFMVTILGLLALVWGMVLIIGWHQGAQRAQGFSQYFGMRLLFLGLLLTLLMAMLGTSS